MQFLERVWKDVKKGENLDLYLTLIVSIFVTVLNLLGSTTIPILSIIMAVLALLTYSALGHRHHLSITLEELTKIKHDFHSVNHYLDDIRAEVSKVKRDTFFVDLLKSEQDILDARVIDCENLLLLGTSLDTTLNRFYADFEEKLAKGHIIKVLLCDPYSPASEMTVLRKYQPITLEKWRSNVLSNLEQLKHLQEKGDLEIRVINYHLTLGGILTDIDKETGMIFLWYYGFKNRKSPRPKFIFYKNDGYWYTFFADEVKDLWENAVPWNTYQ